MCVSQRISKQKQKCDSSFFHFYGYSTSVSSDFNALKQPHELSNKNVPVPFGTGHSIYVDNMKSDNCEVTSPQSH